MKRSTVVWAIWLAQWVCLSAKAGTLIMYGFDQTNDYKSPTQVTPQTSGGGYLPSSLLYIPTIGTCDDCGYSGWGWYGLFGYVNPTYSRFTLRVSTGYVATVTNISFYSRRSASTCPTSYDVQYSRDNTNFTVVGSGALSGTSWQFISANNSGAAITGLTNTVYFRIWAYGATGEANWYHDSVKLEGQVASSSSSNDVPTNIVISSTNVLENLAAGSTVGTFSTQDPDAGDTFVYMLTNGTGGADNSSFAISTAFLLTSTSFNHEVKSNYSIRVRSADQGGLSTQKVFVIHVTDADERPGVQEPAFATNGGMIVRWSSITTHHYSIHYSTNLASGFTLIQSNIPATPTVNSYTDSAVAVPSKFWKITTDP